MEPRMDPRLHYTGGGAGLSNVMSTYISDTWQQRSDGNKDVFSQCTQHLVLNNVHDTEIFGTHTHTYMQHT